MVLPVEHFRANAEQCLIRLSQPRGPPQTLAHYIVKLARLGGYLARSHDPPPGNTVIWRGLFRLTDIELGIIIGAQLVGNCKLEYTLTQKVLYFGHLFITVTQQMTIIRAQSSQVIDFMRLDTLNNYESYSQAGVTPKIIDQGPITQYPLLVAAGRGVSISAESVHGTCDPVLAIPLGEPGGRIEVGMAWRKNETSAAVLVFLKSARRVFARGKTERFTPKLRKCQSRE